MRHKDPRTAKKHFHGKAEQLRMLMNECISQGKVISMKGNGF